MGMMIPASEGRYEGRIRQNTASVQHNAWSPSSSTNNTGLAKMFVRGFL